MATVANRLVSLIESKADLLSKRLLEEVLKSDRATDMRRLDSAELLQRARKIYGDLGSWLVNKTEADVQRYYLQVGEQLASRGIPLSQWMWSVALGRQVLWQFLQTEAFPEGPAEVLRHLELVQTLDQFFERAVYHAAVGFETAQGKP